MGGGLTEEVVFELVDKQPSVRQAGGRVSQADGMAYAKALG